MLLMPIYLKGSIDYLKNGGGDTVADTTVTGAPYNGALGNVIIINIDLANLSETPQTGELSFVAGTILAAMSCSFGSGGNYNFQTLLALCREDNTGHDTTIERSGSRTVFPTPLTFTLPAQGFTRLSAQLWVAGALGNSASTGCPQTATFSFSPKLKIKINEDRGAIIASAMFTVAGMSSSTTSTSCGGRSFPNAHWPGFVPSFDPAPIPINGGRPF